MANVSLRNVRKTYANGVEAIKGVDLAIDDGALCVLVGPSGCGKSTLLRMIAGLETVTSGEVDIGGRIVNDIEPADRDIAMVFQNYALYPHMSVYNNMAYGLRNRGLAKAEIEARVREAAQILEIGALLTRKPKQLSGGQRQRVAMGRAIVRHPKVFLFDEPLSNLDAKLRIAMRVEIRKLQRRLQTTSVYVTHDQLEAMTLADLLVVMNAGRIEQIGASLEVYQKPATTFVAAFIGAPPMNLLPLAAYLSPAALGVPDDALLGIRPEHLSLVTDRPPGDGLQLDLVVDAVEHVGAESFVYGRTPAGHDVIVRAAPDAAPSLGGTITATAPRHRLHLFGADGRRLHV